MNELVLALDNFGNYYMEMKKKLNNFEERTRQSRLLIFNLLIVNFDLSALIK